MSNLFLKKICNTTLIKVDSKINVNYEGFDIKRCNIIENNLDLDSQNCTTMHFWPEGMSVSDIVNTLMSKVNSTLNHSSYMANVYDCNDNMVRILDLEEQNKNLQSQNLNLQMQNQNDTTNFNNQIEALHIWGNNLQSQNDVLRASLIGVTVVSSILFVSAICYIPAVNKQLKNVCGKVQEVCSTVKNGFFSCCNAFSRSMQSVITSNKTDDSVNSKLLEGCSESELSAPILLGGLNIHHNESKNTMPMRI